MTTLLGGLRKVPEQGFANRAQPSALNIA